MDEQQEINLLWLRRTTDTARQQHTTAAIRQQFSFDSSVVTFVAALRVLNRCAARGDSEGQCYGVDNQGEEGDCLLRQWIQGTQKLD